MNRIKHNRPPKQNLKIDARLNKEIPAKTPFKVRDFQTAYAMAFGKLEVSFLFFPNESSSNEEAYLAVSDAGTEGT
jgi:hypothetical protein